MITFLLLTELLRFVERPIAITQIGALVDNANQWSTYVLPSKDIEPGASNITGLHFRDGQLQREDGTALPAVPGVEGLRGFLEFLRGFSKSIVLVGHNIAAYDNGILRESAAREGLLEQFNAVIHGYIDTMVLFQKERPGWRRYAQGALLARHPAIEYNAHDAMGDIVALKQLIEAEFQGDAVLWNHVTLW